MGKKKALSLKILSDQYVKACKRKLQKTVYIKYPEVQKGHNSYKNRWTFTTLKPDL